ncbi:type IV secretory system conjugative DNA transfer family protein [Agrococcus baldri]|uniref:Uncharacterized protein n=1 Tax=Agrococcus baldri TaxID=153730 RepID=A0AA87URZ5_9MICO|nr:type IV secretory system conjugative DNA transfer family protein [Agrococcus baldri]GEK80129.1 hypothetical protein ABA31_14800 [Agrococcus baldri]
MPDQPVFTRLLPGIELSTPMLERFLQRLATPDAPRPVVFETWATDAGLMHLIGRTADGRPGLKSLVAAHLSDSTLARSIRPDAPDHVAMLRQRPAGLPLATDAAEATLFALHSVLSQRQKGETIAVQLVLGDGRGPDRTTPKIADPTPPGLIGLLLRGVADAPSEVRNRVADHASQARIDVTVRIGATAAVPARRDGLRAHLLGAFQQLAAPGTRLDLVNDSPRNWQAARTSHTRLTLTTSQLSPLLTWPVDEAELPGRPPRHPRLLPPPKGIKSSGAILANSTAPGQERTIGITPAGRLQHMAITGGTGSGKSLLMATLALDDIQHQRPLVLLEPKRQLVDYIVSRAPRAAAGRIVIVDAADDQPVGFNPLDIGDRDPGPVVDGILEVFKAVFQDGWGPRTEDLLHAGLLTLVADGQRRGRPHTLLDLPKLLADDGYRRSVIGSVQSDETLGQYWAAFNGMTPAHRASVVAAPLNKLRKYVLRRNVAAVLGQAQPRFRLRDVFRSGEHAVLVPLNDALLGPGASQLLGGLIVAEIWLATQERALEQDPMQRPGMVFIDEVQRYLHLPTSIDDALATSRSYGVAWHLALQGRSQVPASMALALELNARNQITFAASPNDARALARTTTKLTAEDFQSLGPFEIYANLVAGGAPAGWLAARTLPPANESGHADIIRRVNRERFSGDAAPSDATAHAPEPETATVTEGSDESSSRPSNQKRRRS